MARREAVTRVWIEEGCIFCDACAVTAPDVFDVSDDTCTVRPEALHPDFTMPRTQEIMDAAEECPVDVIKFETESKEESDEQAAPKAAAPVESGETAAPASNPGNPGPPPPGDGRARASDQARSAREDPDMQRRSVVSGAALTVGWIALGSGLGLSIGPAVGRFMMPNVVDEPDPRVRVGELQKYRSMRPGEVNEDYKPRGVWIIREGNRVAALSTICTHLGCVPNWMPNDRKFKCPCHGSGFAPNGVNFEGPAPRPLERFRISLEEGTVIVDKSKKFQFELGQWNQPGSYLEL